MQPGISFDRLISVVAFDLWSSFEVEVCMIGLAVFCFRLLYRRLAQSSRSASKGHDIQHAATNRTTTIPPDYCSMIKACGFDVKCARRHWADMMSQQRPDGESLKSMVEVLVASDCTTEAWELANIVWRSPDLHLCASVPIYAALLRGLCKTRRDADVGLLYDEMKARFVPINAISYNKILNSFVQSGQMHRVPELLADMEASGPRAIPNITTFSTLIKGHCQSGNVAKGFEIFDFLRRNTDIKPNEVTYCILLDGCAKQRNFDQAIALLEDLFKDDISPSNYTLSIAIKVFGLAGRLADAFALLEEMPKAYGFHPNIQVITCLVQACVHSRKMGQAFSLYNRVVENDMVEVDQRLYTTLARGCLKLGMIGQAAITLRCAYHLPCGGLLLSNGQPQGIETTCLEEVLAELRRTRPSESVELEAELAACAAAPRQTRRHCRHARPDPSIARK